MDLEEADVDDEGADSIIDDLFRGSKEQVCIHKARVRLQRLMLHEVVVRLNTLMDRILKFQGAQKTTCKDLRYRVIKRNQNDISRCKQFEKYLGPDYATVCLLQQNLEIWSADPARFWSGPSSEASTCFSEPQAETLRRFQLAEHDST